VLIISSSGYLKAMGIRYETPTRLIISVDDRAELPDVIGFLLHAPVCATVKVHLHLFMSDAGMNDSFGVASLGRLTAALLATRQPISSLKVRFGVLVNKCNIRSGDHFAASLYHLSALRYIWWDEAPRYAVSLIWNKDAMGRVVQFLEGLPALCAIKLAHLVFSGSLSVYRNFAEVLARTQPKSIHFLNCYVSDLRIQDTLSKGLAMFDGLNRSGATEMRLGIWHTKGLGGGNVSCDDWPNFFTIASVRKWIVNDHTSLGSQRNFCDIPRMLMAFECRAGDKLKSLHLSIPSACQEYELGLFYSRLECMPICEQLIVTFCAAMGYKTYRLLLAVARCNVISSLHIYGKRYLYHEQVNNVECLDVLDAAHRNHALTHLEVSDDLFCTDEETKCLLQQVRNVIVLNFFGRGKLMQPGAGLEAWAEVLSAVSSLSMIFELVSWDCSYCLLSLTENANQKQLAEPMVTRSYHMDDSTVLPDVAHYIGTTITPAKKRTRIN